MKAKKLTRQDRIEKALINLACLLDMMQFNNTGRIRGVTLEILEIKDMSAGAVAKRKRLINN